METALTVVIPTYNRAQYLTAAVNSVRSQTVKDWYLVVVDDASTDETPGLLAALDDPRISVIQRSCNGGVARSMNDALDLVNTQYLLHLDSDDWLDTDCLATFRAVIPRLPEEVAVVYGNFRTWVMEDGKLVPAWTVQCPLYRSKYEVVEAWNSACPRLYRVEALRAVDGWDVEVLYEGRFVEDLTTISKLAARFGLCHIDHIMYNYRWHGANESRRQTIHRQYIRWLIQRRCREWGGQLIPLFRQRPSSKTVPDVVLLSWSGNMPQRHPVSEGEAEISGPDLEGPRAGGKLEVIKYEYTTPGLER